MHGGAKGSGAPKGNQNALKHGTYTEAALRQRAELRLLVQESGELLQSLKEVDG
jgi:glucans biosynthesis protein